MMYIKRTDLSLLVCHPEYRNINISKILTWVKCIEAGEILHLKRSYNIFIEFI